MNHRNWSFGSKDMCSRRFRGKTVFSRGSGVILEFLEWFKGFGAKDRGSCRVWEFYRDFCGILDGLEWFRTYS
jgi:hypothetical protein